MHGPIAALAQEHGIVLQYVLCTFSVFAPSFKNYRSLRRATSEAHATSETLPLVRKAYFRNMLVQVYARWMRCKCKMLQNDFTHKCQGYYGDHKACSRYIAASIPACPLNSILLFRGTRGIQVVPISSRSIETRVRTS